MQRLEKDSMRIAFTGHRPNKLDGYNDRCGDFEDFRVRAALLAELQRLAPTHAISGMAQGVDQIAALCCLNLGIPFTAAIPFVGQELVWPKRAQLLYRVILAMTPHKHVVCGPEVDTVAALGLRNEWMVDNADHLLAVWDGSRGGTANCVKYAKIMRVPTTIIHPRTGKITR